MKSFNMISQILNEVQMFDGVKKLDKLDKRELTRALRDAIIAEHQAVKHYEAIVDSTDNKKVQKVLQDIADEERVHVFELQELLNLLVDDEEDLQKDAQKEIKEIIK